MSARLVRMIDMDVGPRWAFWCPGCREVHPIDPARWILTGTVELPTFTPSMVYRSPSESLCHLSIRAGRMEFAAECTHGLASSRVTMTPIDEVL